jgi:hypothetical protein
MTTLQLILMIFFYLTVFAAISYFTRASSRRITGALAGAAVIALLIFTLIALGEAIGLWVVPIKRTKQLLLLLYLALAISIAPIYLISWRVVRRYGGRGLTVLIVCAAIIGPARDYIVSARYPEWIELEPRVAPMLAVGIIYTLIVGVGHLVMSMVAGRSGEDRLVRRRWDAA